MKNISFLSANGVDINSSLEIFGDIDTYNKTLGEFIMSAPEKLERLEYYNNSRDMGNFAIYVHSLKSDAKYFGFKDLAELSLNNELKSKNGDFSYIQQNFEALKTAVNTAVNIANQYLNGSDDDTPSSIQEMQNEDDEPVSEAIDSQNQYSVPTILVVDDSNIIRNFVKRIFSDKFGIGTARDGQEAINIINANKENDNIKAMLLDLNMPGVDGFAVLEYMKNNNLFSKIPVSIISGDSSKETIDKAFTYTIVDMLGKPFNDTDVKRILEKTLMYKEML